MPQSLRIAVLECDVPRGETKAKHGTFGNVFKDLLVRGASRLQETSGIRPPKLEVSNWDVMDRQEYPDVEEVDAVLLTGSSKCCEAS